MKIKKGDPIKFKTLIQGYGGRRLEEVFLSGTYMTTIPKPSQVDANIYIVLDRKGNARRVAVIVPNRSESLDGNVLETSGRSYKLTEINQEKQ